MPREFTGWRAFYFNIYVRLYGEIVTFKYLERNKELSESEREKISESLQKSLETFVQYFNEFRTLVEKEPKTDEEKKKLRHSCLDMTQYDFLNKIQIFASSYHRRYQRRDSNWTVIEYCNSITQSFPPRNWDDMFEYLDYVFNEENESLYFDAYLRKQFAQSYTNTVPKKHSFLSWLWQYT